MQDILNSIVAVVASVSNMVGTWLGVIFADGNEFLAFCTILPLVGIGIGLLKRLITVKA